MKRLALLKTLLEREQKRRDEQMANVRNAVANAEAQQQQADGLVAYRTEYCRKWSAQFQQAATIEILRSYQGFLSRLDQAITQQQSVLEHAHRPTEDIEDRVSSLYSKISNPVTCRRVTCHAVASLRCPWRPVLVLLLTRHQPTNCQSSRPTSKSKRRTASATRSSFTRPKVPIPEC